MAEVCASVSTKYLDGTSGGHDLRADHSEATRIRDAYKISRHLIAKSPRSGVRETKIDTFADGERGSRGSVCVERLHALWEHVHVALTALKAHQQEQTAKGTEPRDGETPPVAGRALGLPSDQIALPLAASGQDRCPLLLNCVLTSARLFRRVVGVFCFVSTSVL